MNENVIKHHVRHGWSIHHDSPMPALNLTCHQKLFISNQLDNLTIENHFSMFASNLTNVPINFREILFGGSLERLINLIGIVWRETGVSNRNRFSLYYPKWQILWLPITYSSIEMVSMYFQFLSLNLRLENDNSQIVMHLRTYNCSF